jgi:hypothetical protein
MIAPRPRRRSAWPIGIVVLAALAVAVWQVVRRDPALSLRAPAGGSAALAPALPVAPLLPAAGERLLDAIAPWACHETTINFTPVARSAAHLASAWSPTTMDHLAQVRRRYDPHGLFAGSPGWAPR